MRRLLVAVGAAAALAACTADSVMPTLTATPPSGKSDGSSMSALPPNPPQADAPKAAQPAPAQSGALPPAGAAMVQNAPPVAAPGARPTTPGSPTGTHVGQKVQQLRAELVRLQGLISTHSAELQQNRADMIQQSRNYRQLVAGIDARLQAGAAPGNPEPVAQWNQAQSELDKLDASVGRLNRLTSATAGDSSMATFLLNSTRAVYSLQGAVDEDHRQIAILEDEINRTAALTERLLSELNGDLQRQASYVAGERRNLQLMAAAMNSGEPRGPSLYGRPPVSTAPAAASPQGAAAGAPQPIGGRRPLVVIKFTRPNVEYEQQLYAAASQALDRKPDAMFDVVAVMPAKPATGAAPGVSALRSAEGVMRSLANMGLPPNRVTLSATNSTQAQVNEVHLYVR